MNKYIALTRVLLSGSGSSLVKDGTKRLRKYLLLLLIAISFAPMSFGIGAGVVKMYEILAPIQQQGVLLAFAYSAATMLIFIFGIMYVITVFYFTKDIDNLLPLPLTPIEILSSKFTVTLFYEYLSTAIFLAPVIIAYGYKSSAGILYYIYGILLFLIIPIIPLVIGSIFSMVLMRFTNIGKNKDLVKIISGFLIMIVAVSFNIVIRTLITKFQDPQALIKLFTEGNNSLVSAITEATPNAKFAALAAINYASAKGLMYIAILIVITLAFYLVFISLGQVFYLKGVVGTSEAVSRNKVLTKDELTKGTRSSSVMITYSLKELKILFRTPIFFINCIMMNFLWPVIVIVPMLFQKEAKNSLGMLGGLLNNTAYLGIILAAAIAVGMFLTTTNGISSTAISREGTNVMFTKFIPVKYKIQLWSKIIPGILMGFIATASMIIGFFFIAKPGITITLLIFAFSMAGVLFTNFSGILLDVYFPKLTWDNEQKAVKQNMNVVVNMLIAFALGGGLVYGMVYLNGHTSIDKKILSTIAFSIMVVLNIVMYKLVMTKAVRAFEKLEG